MQVFPVLYCLIIFSVLILNKGWFIWKDTRCNSRFTPFIMYFLLEDRLIGRTALSERVNDGSNPSLPVFISSWLAAFMTLSANSDVRIRDFRLRHPSLWRDVRRLNFGESSNGRKLGFGPRSLGSNPNSPANQ